MKRVGRIAPVLAGWFVIGGQMLSAKPPSKEQATEWTRHLVPLPKSIQFLGVIELATDRIAVVSESDDPLVRQAAKELQECMGKIAGNPAGASLQFRLQVGGTGEIAEALAKLPNHDQAYMIRSRPDGKTIELIGGGVRGTYYAAKTMQQLLRAYA